MFFRIFKRKKNLWSVFQKQFDIFLYFTKKITTKNKFVLRIILFDRKNLCILVSERNYLNLTQILKSKNISILGPQNHYVRFYFTVKKWLFPFCPKSASWNEYEMSAVCLLLTVARSEKFLFDSNDFFLEHQNKYHWSID